MKHKWETSSPEAQEGICHSAHAKHLPGLSQQGHKRQKLTTSTVSTRCYPCGKLPKRTGGKNWDGLVFLCCGDTDHSADCPNHLKRAKECLFFLMSVYFL